MLEPSFGGCGFLYSAHSRLKSLGCREPRRRIYGCDIDPFAFEYLADIFNRPVDLGRFLQRDFLDIEPGASWPESFSCILANPPYIPYQELGTERRRRLTSTKWAIEGLGGRSSLWAYFMAHAIKFLEIGGRMAWVLPGAFLQADYAKPIRDFLAVEFRRVVVIVMRERLFLKVGADEETAILLADGFRSDSSKGHISLGHAETMEALNELIARWESGAWLGTPMRGRPAMLSLDGQELKLFLEIENDVCCKNIGDVASVQIGLVTGANDFFVLSNANIYAANLRPEDCTSVLAKFIAAPGLRFTRSDHSKYLRNGGRGHLIDSIGTDLNKHTSAYLDTFPADRLARTSTFRKRKIWCKTDDGRVPDAFFPVMHHTGPRLVLNPNKFTSTNTIHRVYFRNTNRDIDRRIIVISLLTSFSQLSAEFSGRRYGSGVLKHEPREAESIKLLLPGLDAIAIDEAFFAIDRDLRLKNVASAMCRADALIYKGMGLPHPAETSAQLQHALHGVRTQRRPKRD